jgi:hypothetical protein
MCILSYARKTGMYNFFIQNCTQVLSNIRYKESIKMPCYTSVQKWKQLVHQIVRLD